MSCHSPVACYRSKIVNPSGKRSLVTSVLKAHDGLVVYRPCGKCVGCKLERSRQMAVRCLHESKMHSRNCFITLTYDNANLPEFGTLVVDHLQNFYKRLRIYLDRSCGTKIKHYSCGEYGDVNLRPHYHGLVFGYDLPDKLLYSKSSSGDCIYSSALLDELWTHGSTKVGVLNFQTAAYVARYCMKKVDGAQREAGHYLVHDGSGVCFERVAEFSCSSNGISVAYYDKFGAEIRAHDTLIIDGKEVPSVRYYDKLFEALDECGYEAVKSSRVPKFADRAAWERHNDMSSGYTRYLTKTTIAGAKSKVRSL